MHMRASPSLTPAVALLPLLPQYRGSSTGAAAPVWDVACKPHIFGISGTAFSSSPSFPHAVTIAAAAAACAGYSGAGTTPSDKNDPARLRDNVLPYALAGHIHEREVGFHCGLPVAFMPHVAPFFQGISLTVTGAAPAAAAAGLRLHHLRLSCRRARPRPLVGR